MFYFYMWLGTVLSDHLMQFSEKLINQTSENCEKINFDFDSFGPNMGHANIMASFHRVQYQRKLMIQSCKDLVTDRETVRQTRVFS